jgi:ERCC4-related helicase
MPHICASTSRRPLYVGTFKLGGHLRDTNKSQAIQADSSFIHLPSVGSRNPRPSGRADATTIYRRRYLAIAIDEAHTYCNPNKAYTAMRALREKTDLLVAMTATPVQTRPAVRKFAECH